MRLHVREFVKILSQEFNIVEPIVEIGSYQVAGQESIADMRSIFVDKNFIGCDMRNGKGVDRIENVENLSFKDKSIGTILILDTMEHVENCFNAVSEIHRVLKDEGMVIMSSVMNFPIHDYPSDYWRFTPAAFKLLLDQFPIKIIGFQGNAFFPHTLFGIGIKSNNLSKYQNKIDILRNDKKILPDIKLKDKIYYIFLSLKIVIRSLFDKNHPDFEIEYNNK